MDPVKTHMDIDADLLAEAMVAGAHKTKRDAVNTALREYINLRRRQELLALSGKIRWQGDLDQMRKSRV